MPNRRAFLSGAAAIIAVPAFVRAKESSSSFPEGFLWGAATAGYQVEGNNFNADIWTMENVKPTLYSELSGDACNSLELWPTDLDLVRATGLNTYRFSLEWPRIEPMPGVFSIAMLDHYKAIIEGCRTRGLTPVVTFNHMTTPRWFAMAGGWTNPESPKLFGRYCDRAARHLAASIGYATTLNEPNFPAFVKALLPPQIYAQIMSRDQAMSEAAAKATGSPQFVSARTLSGPNIERLQSNLLAAHDAGRKAIKAARSDLPVGLSLAVVDDEAVGASNLRDAVRATVYQPWLEIARDDDFIGVQNYNRTRWDDRGKIPPPESIYPHGLGEGEVYPPSLANAVRYVHSVTKRPVFVTENGVDVADDSLRARYIPAAIAELKKAMDEGIPVLGYIHWSLMDNYEWTFGYKPRFGLFSVDRETFVRTAKPSAAVLGSIARRNAI